LIIGALTAIFWDGMCPLEKFHLEFQITDGILFSYTKAYTLIVEYAAVLAVLGSIDSLLTSVIADNMTKTRHNSNRIDWTRNRQYASCCFWGIPGAGATKVP
jgi:SulP family sulfate permease